MRPQSDFASLASALGYQFQRLALLAQALTHRSMAKDNNERLEFLGDALVNMIIAEALFQKFDNAKEGELSRLRAGLVRGDTLAKLAKSFQLNDYLQVGIGERKNKSYLQTSVLADAMEAVIGAIYLDGGFAACQNRVLAWFEPYLAALSYSTETKDPKSKLQEWLQQRGLPLPLYIIEKIAGQPHAQTFHVVCRVSGLSCESVGIGTSRRRAEQAAAKDFLKQCAGK